MRYSCIMNKEHVPDHCFYKFTVLRVPCVLSRTSLSVRAMFDRKARFDYRFMSSS